MAGALLFLMTVAGGGYDPAAAPLPPPSHDARAAGVIEGVVRIRSAPPRRTASRYPGAGGTAAQSVQEIPPVVYLKGASGGAGGAATAEMAQQDTAFAPALLVVPTGATVRFPNRDGFFHNVFSYSSAARFDLGRYPRGESKDVQFEEPGLVKVYCEVHESMRAAVLVVDHPFWARPDEDGRFRIEGVPAGSYILVAWHADRGEREVQVEVPASGVVRVDVEL